jgi:hypothetical protein
MPTRCAAVSDPKSGHNNANVADIVLRVEVGGDLFCHFSSVGRWTKWGSWGLLQFYDDPPTPKFKAVMEWAKELGQDVRI